MEIKLSAQDRKRIKEGIGQKYARVAESPEGLFSYPTGRAGLETLEYDPEIIQALCPWLMPSLRWAAAPGLARVSPVNNWSL